MNCFSQLRKQHQTHNLFLCNLAHNVPAKASVAEAQRPAGGHLAIFGHQGKCVFLEWLPAVATVGEPGHTELYSKPPSEDTSFSADAPELLSVVGERL